MLEDCILIYLLNDVLLLWESDPHKLYATDEISLQEAVETCSRGDQGEGDQQQRQDGVLKESISIKSS